MVDRAQYRRSDAALMFVSASLGATWAAVWLLNTVVGLVLIPWAAVGATSIAGAFTSLGPDVAGLTVTYLIVSALVSAFIGALSLWRVASADYRRDRVDWFLRSAYVGAWVVVAVYMTSSISAIMLSIPVDRLTSNYEAAARAVSPVSAPAAIGAALSVVVGVLAPLARLIRNRTLRRPADAGAPGLH